MRDFGEDSVVIIGVDPGKRTGLAVFYYSEVDDHGITTATLDADRVDTYLGKFLIRELSTVPIIISCERFQVGATTVRKTRQPDAMLVTGAMRELAQRYYAKFTLINASDAKAIGNLRVLRQLGWYRSRKDHENDACAQVCAALLRYRPTVYAQLLNV